MTVEIINAREEMTLTMASQIYEAFGSCTALYECHTPQWIIDNYAEMEADTESLRGVVEWLGIQLSVEDAFGTGEELIQPVRERLRALGFAVPYTLSECEANKCGVGCGNCERDEERAETESELPPAHIGETPAANHIPARPPRKLYQALSEVFDWMSRCKGDPQYKIGYEMARAQWVYLKGLLPSGSGIDSGTKIIGQKCSPRRFVMVAEYHHMNESGMYDGWTSHTITVKAHLYWGFELTVGGRNRNDIKDYLYEVYDSCLREEVDEQHLNKLAEMAKRDHIGTMKAR